MWAWRPLFRVRVVFFATFPERSRSRPRQTIGPFRKELKNVTNLTLLYKCSSVIVCDCNWYLWMVLAAYRRQFWLATSVRQLWTSQHWPRWLWLVQSLYTSTTLIWSALTCSPMIMNLSFSTCLHASAFAGYHISCRFFNRRIINGSCLSVCLSSSSSAFLSCVQDAATDPTVGLHGPRRCDPMPHPPHPFN